MQWGMVLKHGRDAWAETTDFSARFWPPRFDTPLQRPAIWGLGIFHQAHWRNAQSCTAPGATTNFRTDGFCVPAAVHPRAPLPLFRLESLTTNADVPNDKAYVRRPQ
jgi:hypothetical protein